MMVITHGTTLEATAIMLKTVVSVVAGSMHVHCVCCSYTAMNGGEIAEAVNHATADVVLIGRIFAFISAGVNAVKAAVRSYNAYQDKLVHDYIQKYAMNSEDATNIANSFEGKVRLKTSKGVKAHRYFDDINAFEKGRYLTNKSTKNPIKDLVLYKNQATKHVILNIAEGQQYLAGHIAVSSVNAVQYFVGNINMLLP